MGQLYGLLFARLSKLLLCYISRHLFTDFILVRVFLSTYILSKGLVLADLPGELARSECYVSSD